MNAGEGEGERVEARTGVTKVTAESVFGDGKMPAKQEWRGRGNATNEYEKSLSLTHVS